MNSKLNPASETISMVKAAQTNEEDIPVAPLPNPGEGGPVYDDSCLLYTSTAEYKKKAGLGNQKIL